MVAPDPVSTQKARPHREMLADVKQCFWRVAGTGQSFGTSGFCPVDQSAKVGDPCSCGGKNGNVVGSPTGDGKPAVIN